MQMGQIGGSMRGVNRERLVRRCATLAVALGAVVVIGLVAGFDGGLLFPIAIGVATAVAIASERGSGCSSSLFRRRG
jgi:hypothetical protein